MHTLAFLISERFFIDNTNNVECVKYYVVFIAYKFFRVINNREINHKYCVMVVLNGVWNVMCLMFH